MEGWSLELLPEAVDKEIDWDTNKERLLPFDLSEFPKHTEHSKPKRNQCKVTFPLRNLSHDHLFRLSPRFYSKSWSFASISLCDSSFIDCFFWFLSVEWISSTFRIRVRSVGSTDNRRFVTLCCFLLHFKAESTTRTDTQRKYSCMDDVSVLPNEKQSIMCAISDSVISRVWLIGKSHFSSSSSPSSNADWISVGLYGIDRWRNLSR